jgi:predicted aldo/keto reductase-like oxidoreductase
MQYRSFGCQNWNVSALGFGAMRLPTVDGKIDEAEAIRMIRYAIDHGVNYIDTAYPYHDGESEVLVGRALKDGYRDKVKLATKLPSWEIKTADDFDRFLSIQLDRLGLDSIDIYLLHALNKGSWVKLRDLGVLDWAERQIADGRFDHLAFSFHDGPEAFVEIVDAYDNWAMAQIQHNYMDVENQAGTAGLKYAADKGLAVVIMEPLLGGKLVEPPQPVQALWDEAPAKRSAAGWALDWLWNQPEVSVVLSGMSTMAQVEENVQIAAVSGVGTMSDEELAVVDRVRDEYGRLTAIPCTGCGYCVPCPQHVDIPGNFGNYNAAIMYEKPDASRGQYAWTVQAVKLGIAEHDSRAANCIQCKECESKCPQQIPISEWMPVVHAALGESGPFVTELPG